MSAAIIFPDGSTWTAASGLAQVSPARRATPDTTFVVGSITKTFVTATIMQLVEEGELTLDDPLADWLPEYPRADQITLRELLNHTSGVFNLFDSPNYTPLVVTNGQGKSWTPQEILDNFVEDPYFAPGTGYHYSNTDFVLLGMVIEAETGKPFGAVLSERFFEPLGLDNTYFQGDGPPPANSARGYERSGGVNKVVSDGTNYRPTESEATVVWAAGGIVASAPDIATWGHALYGGEVVSADSLAQMTDYVAHPDGAYGLGTRTRTFGSQRMFGHTGALRGFNGAMWYLPDIDLTVVVLTNRVRIDANEITDALLSVAVPAVQAN
jgi:D-alanyl-D-alanine carboxypeptidase